MAGMRVRTARRVKAVANRCQRLSEGADIYQIAKNRRTSVE